MKVRYLHDGLHHIIWDVPFKFLSPGLLSKLFNIEYLPIPHSAHFTYINVIKIDPIYMLDN